MNKINAIRLSAVILLVVGLSLAAPLAHADNRGKARMLIKRAKHALNEGRCHMQACPEAFAKAVAQYEKAIQLDPTPANALALCEVYDSLDGTNYRIAVERGLAHKALTRCDFAASHPDSSEETRRAGRRGGVGIRATLSMGRDKKLEGKRRIAAAKALFGFGLKMKYDKRAGKITLDYGKLDAKTLQSYIAEYWSGYATSVLSVAITSSQMLQPGQSNRFFSNAKLGIAGWIMAEPMAKYKICAKLVYAVDGGDDVDQWCKYQALIEANAPLFAFRGKSVTWNVKLTKGGGLGLDERIFLPSIDGVYTPAITIAGPVEIDDYKHNLLTQAMAYHIKSNSKYYQQALGLAARAKKIAAKKKKAFDKKDRRLGGKRGKVVFATSSFVGWDLPPVLSKKAKNVACAELNYKAYAPRKKDRQYEMDVSVDGTICNAAVVASSGDRFSKTQSIMYPEYGGDFRDACPKALLVPGQHKVAISIYENKSAKTGRKKINNNWTIGDEYIAYRGKKKASGSMTCTTQGPATESRFE